MTQRMTGADLRAIEDNLKRMGLTMQCTRAEYLAAVARKRLEGEAMRLEGELMLEFSEKHGVLWSQHPDWTADQVADAAGVPRFDDQLAAAMAKLHQGIAYKLAVTGSVEDQLDDAESS